MCHRKIPLLLFIENNTPKNVSMPYVTSTVEKESFDLTADCIKDCIECIRNLNLMSYDHMNSCVENVKNYEDNKLCDLVKIRLTEYLCSFRKIDANKLHSELMCHNIHRTCVIIKMLKICTSYDLLRHVECHDALFSLDFNLNHCVSTIDNST